MNCSFTSCMITLFLPGLLAAQLNLTKPVLTGTITHPELSEISGLAISHRQSDILWCINDSGNPATLYAVTVNGEFRGRFPVRATNQDWEDLASFVWAGKSYILIADVGDNDETRNVYQLYIVPEPMMDDTAGIPQLVSPTLTLAFRYEDGPKDCESVAVDVKGSRILLICKRTKIPHLYELPLNMEPQSSILIARKTATLTNAPLPTEEQKSKNPLMKYAGQPTAMDVSESCRLAVVLTYLDCWIFGNKTTDWPAAFQQTPIRTHLPLLRQAESICFDQSGRTIYITTEKTPAPIYQIQIE